MPGKGDHECYSTITCQCSITGLEPNEDCPIHMGAPPDRKCNVCGRFVTKDKVVKAWI